MSRIIDIQQVADTEAAARAALCVVTDAAARAIAARGRFVLAVCGGRAPGRLYELLAQSHQDWLRWHIVYGDERCLPAADKERNSSLVRQRWLDAANFPEQNHHMPAVERGARDAAARYAADLAAYLPLDLALLGIGEDGHTASLFPGQPASDLPVLPVLAAPKPPRERISLGYPTLSAADTVCFLATGESKRRAIEACLNGATLPAAKIRGRRQTLLVTDLALSQPDPG